MTADIVCPRCGAVVPPGRMSCQACGALLASVAGSTEPPVTSAGAGEGEAARPDATPGATSEGPPSIIGEWTGPTAAPAVAAEPAVAEEPAAVEEPVSTSVLEPEPAPGPPSGPAMQPTSVTTMGASTARPRKFGEPLFPIGAPPIVDETARAPGAGAPPAAAAASAAGTGGIVAMPKTPAGWLVVAGGVIAAVSFLLPWANAVLGSSTAQESYLGHWGLASPSNILLVLGSLGIAWLAVIPTDRLAWLRTIALPIVAGGLLLGVAWPYVVGPYGAQIGMWAMILGAGLLVAGGFAGLYEATQRRDRPVAETPSDAS